MIGGSRQGFGAFLSALFVLFFNSGVIDLVFSLAYNLGLFSSGSSSSSDF